jgi:aspartate kinase
MLVMKFGGTSVGSAERFLEVARIIEATEDEEVVVVVSAMSGTTTALIDGARAAAEGQSDRCRAVQAEDSAKHLGAAHELFVSGSEHSHVTQRVQERLIGYERLCTSIAALGELTARSQDAVSSIGEEMSSQILAALLRARGMQSEAVSATSIVRTDDRYGSATPDLSATRQLVSRHLLPLVRRGILPVVTGYIGATGQGVTTTLGRGGSDYSAAILGVCLDADMVHIWTDVDGILTADPELVPGAHTLLELSYEEAEELASFGADVLHPKTVAPLAERGIPLRILNSFAPDRPGTLIVSEPDPDRRLLPSIISTEGLSLMEVAGNGSGWSPHMASRALRALGDAGVDVFMFSQSFSQRSLSLVVRRQDQTHSARVLAREFDHDLRLGLLSCVGVREEVATVSVVGMPDECGSPIVPRAFAALGKLGLRVISVAQASSAYSVSFVIAEDDVPRAVPFIHDELGL